MYAKITILLGKNISFAYYLVTKEVEQAFRGSFVNDII